MKAALGSWQREMKKAGFEYAHPDEIEPDLRNRLNALTEGGTISVEQNVTGPESRFEETTGFRAFGRGQKLQAARGNTGPRSRSASKRSYLPGRYNKARQSVRESRKTCGTPVAAFR